MPQRFTRIGKECFPLPEPPQAEPTPEPAPKRRGRRPKLEEDLIEPSPDETA